MDKKKENKILNLEKFVNERNFSKEIYKEIFKSMVKHTYETHRQRIIRGIVTMWEIKNPLEVDKFDKVMKNIRKTRANKFASVSKQDIRLLFKFPPSLWNRIETIMKILLPDDKPFLDDKKEERWFVENFKRYLIPEKY